MSIVINGRTISCSGSNVSIVGNRIIVDGKTISDDATGIVELKIDGDPVSVKSDAPVTVNGNVGHGVTAGGSVHCNNVNGSVQAGGSVHCGKVDGSVMAGGSVHHC